MNLARALIDAALAADLTKNELRVFLALYRQTITYGKTSDPLTLKRLVNITKVRKDRLVPALIKVLEKGLFESTPHPTYETTYQVPQILLSKYPKHLITPNTPKSRSTLPLSEAHSENQIHTIKTVNNNNPTTELPYPNSFSTQQQLEAAKLLDGLIFEDAVDCLKLLNQVLLTGRIKSPLGYLYYLAKSARNGTLDRSTLVLIQSASTVPMLSTITVPNSLENRTDTVKINRIRELQQELYSLDTFYNRAGLAMDTLTATKRAKWVEELNQLI